MGKFSWDAFKRSHRRKFFNRIHVVFGEVVEGQELILNIENTPVDSKARPDAEIIIADCNVIVPEPSPEKGNLYLIVAFEIHNILLRRN